MSAMRKLLLLLAIALLLPNLYRAQTISVPKETYAGPYDFQFYEEEGRVIVRGGRWVPLIHTSAFGSWGPGAVVQCVARTEACTASQFYDGGATRILTTYKINRWDTGRIEAGAWEGNISSTDRDDCGP